MFFELSKYLWVLANPANILLLVLVVSWALLGTRWHKYGRCLQRLLVLVSILIATVPFSSWGLWNLENRFPQMTKLPDRVDGIIVVGGIINSQLSHDRGQPVIGGAVERLTAMAKLAKIYPNAKVIFSGGSGDLSKPNLKEAHFIAPFMLDMGLNPDRVIYENQARNTVENAEITMKVANPKIGDIWLLVTSAFHMPRAMGTFRKAGWKILAYPIDYNTSQNFQWKFFFNFSAGLMQISHFAHELVGLIVYKITGQSQSFFPEP
jgi:uncharacterized SAM-binding protein YcdF (DUF218 family)